MKFQPKHSSLLLLLLPALVNAVAVASYPQDAAGAITPPEDLDAVSPPSANKRHGVPTKDAPVDGKDGKPHLGPFVDSDGAKRSSDGTQKGFPPLDGRPDDPTVVDGKRIPESNDGVMFDKNRDYAAHGKTGLEGGMTEKSKARKAEEDRTGEKVVTRPPPPKEQPPLPHSEEKKILAADGSKGSRETDEDAVTKPSEKATEADYTGLDVRMLVFYHVLC